MKYQIHIRLLYAYCAALTVTVVFLLVKTPVRESGKLQLSAPNGKPSIVISSELPNPIIGGRTYPRQMNLSGIALYNTEGDETGGIGVMSDSAMTFHGLSFDYALHDAISMYSLDRGASFESSFDINDKDVSETDPMKVRPVRRITISDENRNAGIVLRDTKGRPRIILSVDSKNVAKIIVKDSAGNNIN